MASFPISDTPLYLIERNQDNFFSATKAINLYAFRYLTKLVFVAMDYFVVGMPTKNSMSIVNGSLQCQTSTFNRVF